MSKLVLFLVVIFVAASRQQPTKVANGTLNDETLTLRNCPRCECGIIRNGRIVGGKEVENVNRYPWMALLYIGGGLCGGSLINSKYTLLTAAHCVASFQQGQKIDIILMEHNLASQDESNLIVRRADLIIKHPGWGRSRNPNDNDIALLRMDKEVQLGVGPTVLTPVCLPKRDCFDQTFDGVNALVMGWGSLREKSPLSRGLNKVTVPITSNAVCSRANLLDITPNMICAGYPKGGKDACQGDSGAPLVVKTGSKYEQVGIVSFGVGCAKRNSPGVYTRVTNYIGWIAKYTADACYCSN